MVKDIFDECEEVKDVGVDEFEFFCMFKMFVGGECKEYMFMLSVFLFGKLFFFECIYCSVFVSRLSSVKLYKFEIAVCDCYSLSLCGDSEMICDGCG